MENGKQPLIPTVYRKTGENEYKIASEKDIREGAYLSSTGGLTKPEYFAGLTMQALMAATNSEGTWTHVAKDAAKISVEAADALLKELEK